MGTDADPGVDAARGVRRSAGRAQGWWGSLRRHPRFWPGIVIASALFMATLAIVAGWITAGSRSDDISAELARAGLGLAAIAVLGGAVAAAFGALDSERDRRRRIDEHRAATVSELWRAYNRIKAVRRTLRAIGFGTPRPGTALSAKQSAEFHAQMDVLNDAQLTLEKIKRNVVGQQALFPNATCIARLVHRGESYLNRVINDWEAHGPEIHEGSQFAALTHEQDADGKIKLRHLTRFLGTATPSADRVEGNQTHPAADCDPRSDDRRWHGIKAGLSIPVERAAELIGAGRFGVEPAPPTTAREQV